MRVFVARFAILVTAKAERGDRQSDIQVLCLDEPFAVLYEVVGLRMAQFEGIGFSQETHFVFQLLTLRRRTVDEHGLIKSR